MTRWLPTFAAVCLAWASTGFVVAQTPYAPTPGLFPNDAPAAPLTTAPLTTTPPSTAPNPIPSAVPQGTVVQTSVQHATVQPSVALSPPEARASKPLQLPGASNTDGKPRSGAASGFGTMLAALGVVLGLFLAAVALLRRGMPKPAKLLPKEAVEVLGRIPLPGRCQGHLIRVGNKIALVGFNGGHGESLVEITDPVEVDRLAGLCVQDDPHSATTSFRGIVDQFFKEKTPAAADNLSRAEDADA